MPDAVFSLAIGIFLLFLFTSRVRYESTQGRAPDVGTGFPAKKLLLSSLTALCASLAITVPHLATCALQAGCNLTFDVTSRLAGSSQLAAVAVTSAVAEEVVFRGFLLNWLRSGRYRDLANLVQALLFGVLHAFVYKDPVLLIPLIIFGYVLGEAALRSRSIYVPLALHCLWNLGQVLVGQPYDQSEFLREDLRGFEPFLLLRFTPASSVSFLNTSASIALINAVAMLGILWFYRLYDRK